MAGEWRECTLGDVLTLQRGFDLPVDKRLTGNYPVIASTGQVGTHNEALVKGPGVVIGRSGSIGGGQFIQTDFWPLNTTLYIKDYKGNDNRFCYYLLKSLDFSGYNVGSGVPTLNRNHIHPLPVQIPPLPEQRAIAHILGTLDDKIELNRRMNETLEGMARAIFKSWFVDFDPVHAKAEGRDPGLPKPIADLFPDNFQDSELGQIPKGWEVKPLSEVTTVITKGTTPTQDDIEAAPDADAKINYVRVNAIEDDGAILVDKLTTIPESVHHGVLKRSILCENDVLYTIAGTIGRITSVAASMLPANTNQAVAIIRPKPTIPPDFLIFTMRQAVFREELHSNIVHAVQANLSLGMLSKARVVLPSETTLLRLFKPVDDLAMLINLNRKESRTLSTIRDALLPKLISGEICIKDNNKAMEEVR